MSEEWGPWIEHDGLGVPAEAIGVITRCECRHLNGSLFVSEGLMSAPVPFEYQLCWIGGGIYFGTYYCPVIRYQIKKPRGMAVLKSLLADLPETADA